MLCNQSIGWVIFALLLPTLSGLRFQPTPWQSKHRFRFPPANNQPPTTKQPQSRRHFVFSGSFVSAVTVAAAASPLAASARDLLTSRPLEAIRIMNQEAADNLKYGGELAPITGQPNSPDSLLVPIKSINGILKQIRSQIDVETADPAQWEAIRKTLSSPPLSKKEFKQAFNAFADNIYYTEGSERANGYLGGGATPTTQQTTQYLLRNEILSNVETAVLEVDYLIGLRNKGATPRESLVGEELDDLRGFLDKALIVMKQYLDIAEQGDVANAVRLKRESAEWFNESP